MKSMIGFLQVIEKAVEVDADTSQFPSNWIFHAREDKPGKAFVDGLNLNPRFHSQNSLSTWNC